MLDRIHLHTFRNHADTTLAGAARFNLLVGENGAGKTNVLEAISLFAPGRGLRRAALPDMATRTPNTPATSFTISAHLALPNNPDPLHLGTGTSPDRPTRRLIHINGADAPAASLAEWLGLFWLTPAMDRIFADTPAARRRFLDRMALALHPAHARHATRYEAALRERGRLLASPQEPDPHWFHAIESQMAEAGAALATARAALVTRLAEALAAEPPSPFARPSLAYHPGGPLSAPALAEALAASRPRDRAAQRSLIGPHRDELAVTLAAKSQPAAECSTGEQKAMLIAITLAHADLAGSGPDQRPRLLLLDEVAAHLDPLRRDALFERLSAGPAQVWITGTETAPFTALAGKAACWRVSDGNVESQEL